MKMLMILASVIASLMLAAAVAPVMSIGKAKGQAFPPAFLKGNRINLYNSGYRTVPANQPSFVIHGFSNPNWPKGYSAQEKNSALTGYSLVLEIDGVAVKLRKWIHYDTTIDTLENVKLVAFYVQFEANQFAAGTYTFTAVWYGPNMTVKHESIVTVEFY